MNKRTKKNLMLDGKQITNKIPRDLKQKSVFPETRSFSWNGNWIFI